MEGLAVAVSAFQISAYTLSIAKSLADLQQALRHGRWILEDERASINHLKHIITGFISQPGMTIEPRLTQILESISKSVDYLLNLLKVKSQRHLIRTLVFQRREVNDAFAALERKKSNLILEFTAQNSIAIASLCIAPSPRHPKSLLDMSQSATSSSQDSSCVSLSDSQPTRSIKYRSRSILQIFRRKSDMSDRRIVSENNAQMHAQHNTALDLRVGQAITPLNQLETTNASADQSSLPSENGLEVQRYTPVSVTVEQANTPVNQAGTTNASENQSSSRSSGPAQKSRHVMNQNTSKKNSKQCIILSTNKDIDVECSKNVSTDMSRQYIGPGTDYVKFFA